MGNDLPNIVFHECVHDVEEVPEKEQGETKLGLTLGLEPVLLA